MLKRKKSLKPLHQLTKRQKNRVISQCLKSTATASDVQQVEGFSSCGKETAGKSNDSVDDEQSLPLDEANNTAGQTNLSDNCFHNLDAHESDQENVETDNILLGYEYCGKSRPMIVQQLADWASNSTIPHVHINSLLSILRQHDCFAELPKDSRTLLQTKKKYDLKTVSPGLYHHFGLLNNICYILNQMTLDDFEALPNVLELHLNVDGLPLAKSSTSQFWPILGHLPQTENTSPFIIGAYHGLKKPECSNIFLEEFVMELNDLANSGFVVKNKQYVVKLTAVICDAPAKAFVKKIKGHSGYYGCDKCIQKGLHIEGRLTFPNRDSMLRTDIAFANEDDKGHHTGTSILKTVTGIGMVTNFPHDYMHLLCLGAMKKLLIFWIRGKLPIRMSFSQASLVSQKLTSISKKVPCEFVRKPRGLSEIDRWKATEFRQMLLYTGPFVLKEALKKKYSTHFLALNCAIRILVHPNLADKEAGQAQILIEYFFDHYADLYGREQISYNVHSLVHLVDDVNQFGHLDFFSAFKFENYLQEVKRYIKKSQFPLQQLIRRISEQKASTLPKPNFQHSEYPILKKIHCNGPLAGILPSSQYSEVCLPNFTIKLDHNNCVQMSNGSICLVENLVSAINGKLFVIGREFLSVADYFVKPLPSSKVGIFKISKPSSLKVWDISEVSRKVMKLPINDEMFYAAVLLHH